MFFRQFRGKEKIFIQFFIILKEKKKCLKDKNFKEKEKKQEKLWYQIHYPFEEIPWLVTLNVNVNFTLWGKQKKNNKKTSKHQSVSTPRVFNSSNFIVRPLKSWSKWSTYKEYMTAFLNQFLSCCKWKTLIKNQDIKTSYNNESKLFERCFLVSVSSLWSVLSIFLWKALHLDVICTIHPKVLIIFRILL